MKFISCLLIEMLVAKQIVFR